MGGGGEKVFHNVPIHLKYIKHIPFVPPPNQDIPTRTSVQTCPKNPIPASIGFLHYCHIIKPRKKKSFPLYDHIIYSSPNLYYS